MQEAGFWTKYKENTNLKDNSVWQRIKIPKKHTQKKTKSLLFFLSPTLKFPQMRMVYTILQTCNPKMKKQTPSTEGSGHKMRSITSKSVHGFR